MYLVRLDLNPRHRAARRDITDPYQMHATLARVYGGGPEQPLPPNSVLWRLEPETGPGNSPRVLIQSRTRPDWSRLESPDWLNAVSEPLDLRERYAPARLAPGTVLRFRLRGNPSVMRQGKVYGLTSPQEQAAWLMRKGERHGFSLAKREGFDFFDGEAMPDVKIHQPQTLVGRQHEGNVIQVFSALYEGLLTVTDTEAFSQALATGIGRGKVLGLGLLSVAPTR